MTFDEFKEKRLSTNCLATAIKESTWVKGYEGFIYPGVSARHVYICKRIGGDYVGLISDVNRGEIEGRNWRDVEKRLYEECDTANVLVRT